MDRFSSAVGVLLCGVAMLTGCVERILTIRTDPPGARVILNDEEVGVSPAKVSFTWYGDYEIILRKAGYETYKTNYRVAPPWYQIPPIDLVSEVLVPGTIRDEHRLPVYTLTPAETPPVSELVGRAEEMRGRALFE